MRALMADDQVVCIKWCVYELGDDEVVHHDERVECGDDEVEGVGSVLGGGEGLGYSIYCGRLVEYI